MRRFDYLIPFPGKARIDARKRTTVFQFLHKIIDRIFIRSYHRNYLLDHQAQRHRCTHVRGNDIHRYRREIH